MTTTFLGTGAMGGALAEAALQRGRDVTVWNRTPDRARPLGERGASLASSPEQSLAGEGTIVVCLLDHQSVHDTRDPLTGQLAGRTLLNLTTTSPSEARGLAAWAAEHGITYLDGAVMATPELIGGPESAIFYSGSTRAFEEHRDLLDLWGQSSFFGPDAGMASLYDLAMLAGMYTMFAGFLHGAAMVAAEGVPASEFAARCAPFLAAMTGGLAEFAGSVDAKDYTGAGQQSLRFTRSALATLLRASTEQGVDTAVLAPVHELVQEQITAGFGEHGTARIFEALRSTR
jgi:3-hydroxyisobutyrate dehydrogenase-like beta-hydroxyacid dehydrogenase